MPISRKAATRLVVLCASFVSAIVCIFLVSRIYISEALPVLRASAGASSTKRYEIASYFKRLSSKSGLKLDLIESAGSVECLHLLRSGQLDVAFINSCIDMPHGEDIRVVGVLGVEPFHVLIRTEKPEDVTLGEWLKGKRFGVGTKGSTEWLFAHEALAYERLKIPSSSHPGDVTPVEYSRKDLLALLKSIQESAETEKASLIDKLPECMIVHDSMPSTIVQSLVETVGYQLVPIAAQQAFMADTLQASHSYAASIERQFLEPAIIPMLSYLGKRRLPKVDCSTLGARLIVVAHKNVPEQAVKSMMKTLFEGEFHSRIQSKSPRDIPTPYVIHPGAVAYLDRDKPVAVNQFMEGVNKALSILGAMSAGGLSIYGLFWKKKSRKPTDYFAEIRKMELLARSDEADLTNPTLREDFFRTIDDRLLKLRHELIEDICEGRISSEQSVSNIIALLHDYRRSLPGRMKLPQADPNEKSYGSASSNKAA